MAFEELTTVESLRNECNSLLAQIKSVQGNYEEGKQYLRAKVTDAMLEANIYTPPQEDDEQDTFLLDLAKVASSTVNINLVSPGRTTLVAVHLQGTDVVKALRDDVWEGSAHRFLRVFNSMK